MARMTKALCWLLVPTVLAAAAGAADGDAGESAIDKRAFNLFNPTPSPYLRELSIDGPGATESAYTVDAGHFQAELTLASYTSDRGSSDGATWQFAAWAVGHVNLKVGLLNRLDAQLVLETYNHVYEREGADRVTHRGYGDTTVRLKYNFWGNDGGRTAFAATPFVKIPTSAEGVGNSSVEGGLILPLEVALPLDFGLGLTTRFDAVRNNDERGYHPEFINSIALGHDLFGNLAGYVEFFSAVSTERGANWVGTFDAGLIYALTNNIQIYAGTNIGVTHSADDWSLFAGLAWRF